MIIFIYLSVQLILVSIANKYYLKNKLKFKEMINISIINGLAVALYWFIITIILAFIMNFLGQFGVYAVIIGPVLATLFSFQFFIKRIGPYIKNISYKKARNTSIFMILFNIILISLYIVIF